MLYYRVLLYVFFPLLPSFVLMYLLLRLEVTSTSLSEPTRVPLDYTRVSTDYTDPETLESK